MKTYSVELQEYEIKNILKMLRAGRFEKSVRGSDLAFSHEIYKQGVPDEKIVKQLKFTEGNLKRQTSITV